MKQEDLDLIKGFLKTQDDFQSRSLKGQTLADVVSGIKYEPLRDILSVLSNWGYEDEVKIIALQTNELLFLAKHPNISRNTALASDLTADLLRTQVVHALRVYMALGLNLEHLLLETNLEEVYEEDNLEHGGVRKAVDSDK